MSQWLTGSQIPQPAPVVSGIPATEALLTGANGNLVAIDSVGNMGIAGQVHTGSL